MFKLLIPIIVGLLIAVSAHAATTRTLRIGNQSVTLTSDKRSAPALAVQMHAGDIWYGTLTGGTAPGRLTVQMPAESQFAGQVFSLITAHTFSTIQGDFPQVWTWDLTFRNTHPTYNGTTVSWGNAYDANLRAARDGHPPIWPTYHVQAMCSNTTGTSGVKGNPVHASNGQQCWCRLKQRDNNANGGWVFALTLSTTTTHCASNCPANCAYNAADITNFRAALLGAFANP